MNFGRTAEIADNLARKTVFLRSTRTLISLSRFHPFYFQDNLNLSSRVSFHFLIPDAYKISNLLLALPRRVRDETDFRSSITTEMRTDENQCE